MGLRASRDLGRILALAAVLGLARAASAVEYDVEVLVDMPEDVYALVETGDIDADAAELFYALLERPLELNRADRDLLYDLPGVSLQLADAIVAARAGRGGFTRADDLLAVPGMTAEIFAQVRPFVRVAGVAEEGGAGLPYGVAGRAEVGSIARKAFIGPWDGAGRTEAGIDWTGHSALGPQSYMRLAATGATYYGAGVLLTHRSRTAVSDWTIDGGGAPVLLSPGRAYAFDLERAYAFANYERFAALLGSYNVGFGERLTFNTTTQRTPSGWRESDGVRGDNEDGRWEPERALFGGVVSAHGLPLGAAWLDVTVFGSYQDLDAYQYDFGVYDAQGDYDAAAVEPDARWDGVDERGDTWTFLTIRDAIHEELAGGNATLSVGEAVQVGVTGYVGRFSLKGGEPWALAPSARYPRGGEAGAVGVHARWDLGQLELRGEFARTRSGGNGLLLRGIAQPHPMLELTLSLRSYGPDFDNPRANPEAARDEAYGFAARNERGVRLDAVLRPIAGLRLVSFVDLWENPYADVDPRDDVIGWERRGAPIRDLVLRQRAVLSLTAQEDVSLHGQYADKNLARGGPDESYSDSDSACITGDEPDCGSGSQWQARVSVTTTRLPRARLTALLQQTWQDDGPTKGLIEGQRVGGRVRVDAWDGATLTANVSYYLTQLDTQSSALSAYVNLRHGLGASMALVARYALLHYRVSSLDWYSDYHVARISFESHF